jgi:L-fuculose-phosphate aldolase
MAVQTEDQKDLGDVADEIVRCGRALTDKGLLSQSSGNLSVRVSPDRVLITPTGIPYHDIRPEDLVLVDLAGVRISGDRSPSSELPLHTAVYRDRDDLQAIVHTHSPMATTLAILNRPIPAVHYMIAGLGVTQIGVAPYATFGSEQLASNVRAAFAAPARGVLIGNHGVVAGGPTLRAAATAAESIEILAGHYYRCLAVGDAVVLDDQEMAGVLAKYRDAGVLGAP